MKRKKATKRRVFKKRRKAMKKKHVAKKASFKKPSNVVSFKKYLNNKKVLKGLRGQILKEFKSDSFEIVQLKKILKNENKKAA